MFGGAPDPIETPIKANAHPLATLILHLAAEALPTAREISAEENARAAVIAARRNLWAVYENFAAKENPEKLCAEVHA